MLLDSVEAQPGAVRVLAHALATGRIASAYLFVGPSGVGKQRAAVALACAALCPVEPGRGCGHCEVEKRAREGNHPDLRIVLPRSEGSRNLQVETIRTEILPLVRYAPFEGPATFLIFPEADVSFPVQHPEAANAMLKALEEPRGAVHFVLLSERPARLLSTIRSRCQQVRFGSLPRDLVERILEREGVEEGPRKAAGAIALGRADRALELAREGRGERVLELAQRVDAAITRGAPGGLVDLCEELARDADRDLVLESLALFYRDVAVLGLDLDANAVRFPPWADAARTRARTLDPARAAGSVAALAMIREAIERNANPEIALEGFVFGPPKLEFARPRG